MLKSTAIKSTFAYTALAAALAGALMSATPAKAGDYICGHYAFGGAFQNYNNAIRQANNINGMVLDLGRSNSPNAGKGYWVVAKGPFRKHKANNWASTWRSWGVNGAYRAYRCFNGV